MIKSDGLKIFPAPEVTRAESEEIMRIMWDSTEREYIFDHGWKINADGKIEITKEQFRKYQYTGKSLHDKSVKTLMLPSVNGCCLIFENKHFVIV